MTTKKIKQKMKKNCRFLRKYKIITMEENQAVYNIK